MDVSELTDVGVLWGGEAERRSTESQVHHFFGVSARVQQQVMAGDTDVDGAPTHIHGDVERTQVEQLHIVVGVFHNKLAWVAPQAVAGFGKHGPCRF